MDLETWRNGIDICIDNVLRLYEDGKLLIENGSFGHACFSFITAFEEMGLEKTSSTNIFENKFGIALFPDNL